MPRERKVSVAQSGCNRAVRAGRGFGVTAWIGMLGPAGMDAAIVEQIAGHIQEAQTDAVYQARVKNLACVEAYLGPKDFAAFLERETDKMKALVQDG
jgi:tripartite-type tricarboxylate transporter receptor subunit TctC